ncbi:helix-turn-helix transcriptional regulator [Deinococcus sp. HMF7604]|uniref:helix-turn-helix domain-containing protein n=1 Tax=Deinococcus betulae TaxID=2873312 RepID=UPI001CCCB39B|nr:helix-turn-helix transcriptional regulator [Deinococcus betulae]MBZ9752815.1 helix-turn-helix transcriptional regulator [Deinococcus betulae]
MIRNDTEYKRVLQQIEEGRAHFHAQRASFQEQGVPVEAADIALQATESFLLGLEEDAAAYLNAKSGHLTPLGDLKHIGRWLIHARIARGLSQRELAERLQVSEAQVSRDERNEYSKVGVDRAQAILDAMGVALRVVEDRHTTIPTAESAAYTIPFETHSVPSSEVDSELYRIAGNFRAKKNLSPEKTRQIAHALNNLLNTLAEDDSPAVRQE